jgi:hypothetical protein
MLPMIVTVCLSKGAVAMSKKKVSVKRLNAIQNLGARALPAGHAGREELAPATAMALTGPCSLCVSWLVILGRSWWRADASMP